MTRKQRKKTRSSSQGQTSESSSPGHKRRRSTPTQETAKKGKSWADRVILILLVCVGVCLIVLYLKVDRAEVISASMEPTLLTNEKVTVINGKTIKRFNLAVFYSPANKKEKYVKRVVGVPGDQIEFKDDRLYVNGDEYLEPYLDSNRKKFASEHPEKSYTTDFVLENIPGVKKGVTTVPDDAYLVLGDNRQNSQDSRYIGLIPKDNIIGTVWKKNPLPAKK